tara:strand:+ start:1257 stop:3020 length:1764 start_codon:yes stop_codon:yes gene_type:complete
MNRKGLIKKYIDFFKTKQHKEIPNVSLIPENDPTTLFIGSGVETIIPYVLGQPHPLGKLLVNNQRSIRTQDIDEVGDESHHTLFEMLGNWSLGDYWKEEAIKMTYEFLTKSLNIPKERLAATCFKGDNQSNVPKDTESEKVYLQLGFPKERIVFLGKKDNFWGPAGETGPCGPNTEIFYWKPDSRAPKKFDPENNNWLEIGNNVLMQYNKNKKGEFIEQKQKTIDFGGGVERIIVTLRGFKDNYEADMWKPIIQKIEHLSNKKYGKNKEETKIMRIIADHIKASVFIIADGIIPSNTEQGYVLRRLIRRTIINLKKLGFVGTDLISPIAKEIFKIYEDYKHLHKNQERIMKEFNKEEEKFEQTLDKGLNLFTKLLKNKKTLSGKDTFLLFQSYGFPIEMTRELAKEKNIKIDEKSFYQEQKKHQKLSRTSTEGKFKSGLADHSRQTTKLHTATHLLLAALRKVLKDEKIVQKGSNITSERLRLDFNYPMKLTKEELKKIEDLVNDKIKKAYDIIIEEMSPSEARKKGALGVFDAKYGEVVSVYTIKNCSKEICAGPHVKNTSELGNFKIKKEESSSEGIRRIKAILE